MDAMGRLQVNSFLQVDGHENVFAVGDCNDVKERKLGMLASQQGTRTAKNILAHAEGKALTKYSGECDIKDRDTFLPNILLQQLKLFKNFILAVDF